LARLKKILVIGGTGFIGFHLLKAAKRKHWLAYSVSTKKPSKNRFVKGVKYIFSNLENYKDLKKKLIANYDYVVNASGQNFFVNSKEKKKILINNHFFGLLNLIKIFSKKKIKKFIQIGSGAEYGENFSPQIESKDFNAIGSYGSAKLASSKMLIALNQIQDFPAVILRPFQLYGPNQDENKIVPLVITGCLKNKKIYLTKSEQIRDFCYIDDFVTAVFKLLKKEKISQNVLNIGSGKPVKLKVLVKKIYKKIKAGKLFFGKIKYRKDENKILYPNIKKIKKEINWHPKINLDHGLMITIDYYKQFYKK